MRTTFLLVLLAWTSSFAQSAAPQKRPLRLDDLYQLRQVKDPQRSPDGNWVAFTVSTVDVKKDKSISHLWLASWDGKQERQLTFSDQGENTPRWSADGRQLAFLSSRTDACEKPQLWLLPLAAGGEAVRLTEFQRDIDDFAWSPDGKRLVLVVEDDPDEMKAEKPEPEAEPAKPKPGAASRPGRELEGRRRALPTQGQEAQAHRGHSLQVQGRHHRLSDPQAQSSLPARYRDPQVRAAHPGRL